MPSKGIGGTNKKTYGKTSIGSTTRNTTTGTSSEITTTTETVTGTSSSTGTGKSSTTGTTVTTRRAERWFVQGQSQINLCDPPRCGDWLLNTTDCQIYQFRRLPLGTSTITSCFSPCPCACPGTGGPRCPGQWVATGQFLQCGNCEQVYSCLRNIPCFSAPPVCSVSFQLHDCSAFFTQNHPLQIYRLSISGDVDTGLVPSPGTFQFYTIDDLATRLALPEFSWTIVQPPGSNIWIFINEVDNPGTGGSSIIFQDLATSALSTYPVQVDCPTDCGCTGCPTMTAPSFLMEDQGQLAWVSQSCLLTSGIFIPTITAVPTGIGGGTGTIPYIKVGNVISGALNFTLTFYDFTTFPICFYFNLPFPAQFTADTDLIVTPAIIPPGVTIGLVPTGSTYTPAVNFPNSESTDPYPISCPVTALFTYVSS